MKTVLAFVVIASVASACSAQKPTLHADIERELARLRAFYHSRP